MTLTSILGILESLYATLSPFLKPLEETEVAALRLKYASNPAYLFLINAAAAAAGL